MENVPLRDDAENLSRLAGNHERTDAVLIELADGVVNRPVGFHRHDVRSFAGEDVLDLHLILLSVAGPDDRRIAADPAREVVVILARARKGGAGSSRASVRADGRLAGRGYAAGG